MTLKTKQSLQITEIIVLYIMNDVYEFVYDLLVYG